MITGAAKVAGVVGWPVKHSLSPLIHNAWIEALGLDAVYVPFAVPPERFVNFVRGLSGVQGVNVTVPHKEAALALADTADQAATDAGASNLLLFTDKGIEARNTDGIGLLNALAKDSPDFEPKGSVVLMIGAGGAARGAATALKRAGASEIRIINRTRARAEELAALVGGTVHAFDEPEAVLLRDVTLAVNATTLGLNGVNPFWMFFADVPKPRGATVLDMVYRPLVTPFLELVLEQSDWTAVTGLSMLIEQARPSFEALFGQPSPENVDVYTASLKALGESPD